MSQFSTYLNHLINNHPAKSAEILLGRDYAIIYDFLMDLLEIDEVIGNFLIKNKQEFGQEGSNIKPDILLDFTKEFKFRSFMHESFLSLALHKDNHDTNIKYRKLFNQNYTLISHRITECVWQAFHKGFSKIGTIVRGYRGDIYELTLSSSASKSDFITISAYSDDITIKIHLRILIKYSKYLEGEPNRTKPYPSHILKRDWFAMVPVRKNSLFEFCTPNLEKEIKKEKFTLVMIHRLLRHLLQQHKTGHFLRYVFLDSAIYIEYLGRIRNQKEKLVYDCVIKDIFNRISHNLNSRTYPYFFNMNLNLMGKIEKDWMAKKLFHAIKEISINFTQMIRNESITYEDFIHYIGNIKKSKITFYTVILLNETFEILAYIHIQLIMASFSTYMKQLIDNHPKSTGKDFVKDYSVIYEFLMVILEKDDVIGPFIIRNKQISNVNADILLDLTKKFVIRPIIRSPLLSLVLRSKKNAKEVKSHKFFNENRTLISHRITESIWQALKNGFSQFGTFVRGHRDDIYELKLTSSEKKFDYVSVYAKSEDIEFIINLRILIKYTNLQKSDETKPYPYHVLKRDWLAVVPVRKNFLFEICTPFLEQDIMKRHFEIATMLRLLRHMFHNNRFLIHISHHFLESAIYTEYLEYIYSKKKVEYVYFLNGVLMHFYYNFRHENFPYFWNINFNLIKYFDKDFMVKRIFQEINEVINNFTTMIRNKDLTCEDFIKFIDPTKEPNKYQVDQFGIFKSF